MRIQIPDRGLALSGTAGAPHPPDQPSTQHQALVLGGDDDLLAAHVNHRVMAVGAAAHGSRRGDLVLLDSAHGIGPVITAFLRGATDRLAM